MGALDICTVSPVLKVPFDFVVEVLQWLSVLHLLLVLDKNECSDGWSRMDVQYSVVHCCSCILVLGFEPSSRCLNSAGGSFDEIVATHSVKESAGSA